MWSPEAEESRSELSVGKMLGQCGVTVGWV